MSNPRKHPSPPPAPVPAAPMPRPRRIGLIRCLLLTALAMSAVEAHAANPLDLDIALKSLRDSQPPRMLQDELVLSLKPPQPARFVGVRFANESWRILHPYERNDNGVFVLDYPVPEGVREIRYRVEVDGLWMADPSNPNTDVDATGVAFSVFTLDQDPPRTIINPRPQSDGEVTFVFRGTPGKRVALVGDFNNWDPFMDLLDEAAPGSYAITLRVPAGEHWYHFFTEGRRVLDPFNSQRGANPDGVTESYFTSPLP